MTTLLPFDKFCFQYSLDPKSLDSKAQYSVYSDNLDLFENTKKDISLLLNKPSRGGSRKGAGRKAKRGKTSVMRIPDCYKNAINSFIEHLDSTRHIDSNFKPQKSSCFFRSLDDKPQIIEFVTKSK